MVRFNKKKHYNFILLASLTNRTYILHDTKGRIQDTYFCLKRVSHFIKDKDKQINDSILVIMAPIKLI
jgi:hypothetical protein